MMGSLVKCGKVGWSCLYTCLFLPRPGEGCENPGFPRIGSSSDQSQSWLSWRASSVRRDVRKAEDGGLSALPLGAVIQNRNQLESNKQFQWSFGYELVFGQLGFPNMDPI